MDAQTAATALDGNQYTEEGSKEFFAQMKEHGLVAVFGASDDLMEFRGAIYDEIGAWDGTTAHVNDYGLLQNDCENDDCPHFEKLKNSAKTIEAKWCPDDQTSWEMETEIPHAKFNIMEDDETYCRGLVFKLADAA